MEMSAVLASAEGQVVDDAVATLERRGAASLPSSSPEERRSYFRALFGLVVQCVDEGHVEPIIISSEQIATHRFVAGFDFAEIQGTFSVLEEVLWRYVTDALAGEQLIECLGVNSILAAGRDTLARTYATLASRGRIPAAERPAGEQPAGQRPADFAGDGNGFAGDGNGVAAAGLAETAVTAGALVATEVLGHVGVITLAQQRKRNALSGQMVTGVIAALAGCRPPACARSCCARPRECACGRPGTTSTSCPGAGATRWPTTTRSSSCCAPSAYALPRSSPWCTARSGAGRSTWCSAAT